MDQFSGGRSAALMLQRFPTMTPEALKTLILNLGERCTYRHWSQLSKPTVALGPA